MAKKLQLFKGGLSDSHEDRLVINQRPADGHLKSATWEDYARLNRYSFCSSPPKLEVGDVIILHTVLTFGLFEGLGIRVITPEEGLKFKLVSTAPLIDLNSISAHVFEYDGSGEQFTAVPSQNSGATVTDIGDKQRYYYFIEPESDSFTKSFGIGLEVVALPAEGMDWTIDIESRLHQRQLVRPPASMNGCC